MRFVDTNVLLYATSDLPEEGAKRRRARKVLEEPDIAFSIQVLQEYYNQATRATRTDRLSHDAAVRFLEPLMEMPVQPLTLVVFRQALEIRRRFQLSYWDAAILAAARAIGCNVVYSEDLSSEQDYGGIRVIDPFADPAPQ